VRIINKDTIAELDALGFGSDIDDLESYVASAQDSAGMGTPIIEDAIYDKLFKLLKLIKPNSYVLNRNWEVEDNDLNEFDEVLEKYGMTSITTVNTIAEAVKFKQGVQELNKSVTLFASVKENGHACRVVYINGWLYRGYTRGRRKKGRDITRHVKILLPNSIEKWRNIPIVEVRGEILVSKETFETKLKGSLKTPLSSVTSLIRESATDNEIKLMDILCYKVLSNNGELKYNTLWDEFEDLKALGFKTPEKVKLEGVTFSNIDEALGMLLNHFEKIADTGKFKYACDGVVVAIDNNSDFYTLGREGNTWKANVALKIGKHWGGDIYSSEIMEVVFTPGKSYMTPKAIIKPITTLNGSQVTNVPLYNIGVMERYTYIPGRKIYFKFGGEQGVTTTDAHGNSVSD